ncbi:MAG: hypothetical protein JWP00_4844 [Chloroflexi bacterium]|jgi:hypothetical protein|nr:hypothetical protein [Chloroflexota bacterium]
MLEWHQRGGKTDAEFETVVENYLTDCLAEESRIHNNTSLDPEERTQELEALRHKIDELENFLARLRGQEVISPEELRLRRDIEEDATKGLIAMDTVYTVYRPDIHRYDGDEGKVEGGNLVIRRKSGKIELQIPMPGFEEGGSDNAARWDTTALDQTQATDAALVAVTEVARAALGDYAARVMHLLFEIANDYPHWRTPNVTFSVNEFLDRLGYARDKRGIHYSKNRRYLMRALVALQTAQIIAERPIYDKGKNYREVIMSPLLTGLRTIYDNDEEANKHLSTWELFEKGVPGDVIQVRIGPDWYEGVRRSDGSRGNNYTLVPRLGDPKGLSNPTHTRTEDRMENYLYTRYKELRYARLNINILRSTALDKAGVTTKNVTRATQILQKALDKLQTKGVITGYNPKPLPLRPNESFTVDLNEQAFYQRRRAEDKK